MTNDQPDPSGKRAANPTDDAEADHAPDRPPEQGGTWKSQQGDPAPRQPHEHDQSSDSQDDGNVSAQEVGEQAFEDVTSGKKDTDRGPVVDEVYKRQTTPGA